MCCIDCVRALFFERSITVKNASYGNAIQCIDAFSSLCLFCVRFFVRIVQRRRWIDHIVIDKMAKIRTSHVFDKMEFRFESGYDLIQWRFVYYFIGDVECRFERSRNNRDLLNIDQIMLSLIKFVFFFYCYR